MKILFAPFAARLPDGRRSPKDYPFAVRLNELLVQAGHDVTQVGSNQEPQLARKMERGRSFHQLLDLIAEHDTAVCVDSYLQHAMWFAQKPAVVLWGPSDYKIFGHHIHVNLTRGEDYVRARQFERWRNSEPNPEAFVKPEVVVFHVHRLGVELGLHQP
jgi:ADP-heptose:LPS heptosyltransferase